MKKYYSLIFYLLINYHYTSLASDIRKYMVNVPIKIIKREAIVNQEKVNTQIQNGKIIIHSEKNKKTFTKKILKKNDLILLNIKEKKYFNLHDINSNKSKQEELIPIIYWTNSKKEFGLISTKKLNKLKQVQYTSSSLKDILSYPTPETITVVYVLCDKDRNNLCKILIKKNNQWIKDSNNKLIILEGIARSRYNIDNNIPKSKSIRLLPNSDTPQGIYRLYASTLSDDKNFGLMPRINLDVLSNLIIEPIGFYNTDAILDKLIPQNTKQEYWANEWILAYALGRFGICIHANAINKEQKYILNIDQKSFYLTQGCINLGDNMPQLLNSLKNIGLFNKNYVTEYKLNGKQVDYNFVNNIGHNFVIVIDVDSKNLNLQNLIVSK